MSRQETYAAVQRILNRSKRQQDADFDPVPFFQLAMEPNISDSRSSSSDSESELAPPPFDAVVVSPPESALTIYLGSVSDAMYPRALRDRKIKAIVNVAARQCSDVQRIEKMSHSDSDKIVSQWERVEFSERWYREQLGCSDFRYLTVEAEDHPRYRIVDDFEACFQFLDQIERSGGSVLVHCMQGLNRSAAVCMGWLIRKYGMEVTKAVEQVASKRKGILSNRAFAKQIVDWALPAPPQVDERPKPRVVVAIGNVVERM